MLQHKSHQWLIEHWNTPAIGTSLISYLLNQTIISNETRMSHTEPRFLYLCVIVFVYFSRFRSAILQKKSFSYDSCQLPAVPSQLACFFIFLPRTPSSFKACRNCKWHLLLPWDFLRFHFVSSEQHEKRILLEKRLALKAGFLERTTLWLLLTCCKTFAQHGLHYK